MLCCLTPLLHAQTALSGKVVSAGTNEPLVGVNIRVDNSLTGCTTNGRGEFTIDNLTGGQHTLRFSYIGFTPGKYTTDGQETDILVKQFDAIEVLPAKDGQPAIMANGSLSLGENIADQGGLRVSHTAFRNSLNGTEPAPIDGFTADQRFYLAYATLWAQNIRDEEIARLTKLDVHSLGKWRVNATLRNLQDFYDAFSMTDGEMFMPEEERVVIW